MAPILIGLSALAQSATPASAASLYLAWRGPDTDDGIYAMRTTDVEQSGRGGSWCQLPGKGTATGVSLTNFPNKVYMAWKGVSGDDTIYWSRLNSTDVCGGWEPQHQLSDRGTAGAPAIMAFNDVILMVWRGVSDDRAIYWSLFDGTNWTPQKAIPGIGTDADQSYVPRPGLAVFNGLVYMAWRGIHDDDNIYWTTFDGKQWNSAPEQRRLTDRRTFASPALGVYSNGLAPVGGKDTQQMIMVWPGKLGDLCMYWSTFDPPAGNFDPQRRMFNSFHTVNQVALQNYGTGSEIDPHNKLYSFRAGNDTVCIGPPDDIFPHATLGAVDTWAPATNPAINDGWLGSTQPFTARLSGLPGMTVGPSAGGHSRTTSPVRMLLSAAKTMRSELIASSR